MKNCLPLVLSAAITVLAACSSDVADEISNQPQPKSGSALLSVDAAEYAAADGSPRLSYSPAVALSTLVGKMDQTRALEMNQTQITEAQMAEIKAFVDSNLKGESDTKTFYNIFNWIYKNMTYASSGTAYLDPYDVFVYKRCVCQGYANLLKTMCISQGIPCFVANGYLSNIGGHAWNYVCPDGVWMVSDPTNNGNYTMTSTSKYENWLMPQSVDLNLFEDEGFAYTFYDNSLSVSAVKPVSGRTKIVCPYSVAGCKITMFHPLTEVANTYTTLCLGKNIESLGYEPQYVQEMMPTLAEVYVEEGSTRLEAYKNVVYQDGGESPYFIPAAIRRIELKPMKAVEKNTLYYLDQVEEVVVAEGTERIEAYAFEKCPNLRTVYVPSSVTYIDPDAAYNCAENVAFVRTSTGIRPVYR